MMRSRHNSTAGTVTLVALCFVAVIGITLASYIAVCSRAMNLSNRSFQGNLSKQLAELGVDEALRAFNKNDWSNWASNPTNVTSGAWTLDTTNKRATRTISFDAGKLGQGLTGTVKIRIDNYDANQLDSTWSSSANYRINDLVGYNGTWYRCVQNHSNQAPNSWTNLTYWVPTPIPWTWNSSTTYAQYDVVNYNGAWYRCHTSCTNIVPTSLSYWAPVASISLAWTSGTYYGRGSMVQSGSSYTWYYCISSHTSSGAITLSNTSYWAPVLSNTGAALTPTATTYAMGDSFFIGDYVYRSGTGWLRCVAAQPYAYVSGDYANSSLWVNSSLPYISLAYNASAQDSFNKVVYYNGTWYRYINATASSGTTPALGANWEYARSGSMFGWNSSGLIYNLGDVVYSSSTGQWYRCILAHTSSGSIPPTNTTYWSNAPLASREWDSGRQYSQYDTVRYKGVRYLSLQNTNISQNPATATTYWVGADTSNTSYIWDAGTSYSVGVYRCYGGAWYKCIAATTANAGHSPNNSIYWTAAWAQSAGVTTGTPVIYSEGTINIVGSPSTTTQLRTTISPAPLFPNAVAATTSISANSGGTVDSYDSTLGTTYASQVNTSTNYSAIIAAAATSGTAVTLSSTTVKGYVAAPSNSTSPYAPLFSSGGSVKGASSPASPNIDLTRVSRSPYIPQFDTLPLNASGGGGGLAANWATVPKGTALALATTTNIGTPGATTPSRYYYNGNLTIGSASITNLKINGPVILYINGDLFISNPTANGRIDISATGSAEIHVSGVFKADAGGEGILSANTNPRTLIIISDSTSTTTQFYSEGVNPLYGCIYMPYSTSTTGYYNNNNATNIYGAISANNITYSGANLNVHYDTSLRYATFGGVDQPYTINEWRALPMTERATMP